MSATRMIRSNSSKDSVFLFSRTKSTKDRLSRFPELLYSKGEMANKGGLFLIVLYCVLQWNRHTDHGKYFQMTYGKKYLFYKVSPSDWWPACAINR
jgi:hypothetical protein